MFTFLAHVIAVLYACAAAHKATMALLALAGIGAMPEKLPPPLDRVLILVWSYEWLRDTLKVFVSFRGPK